MDLSFGTRLRAQREQQHVTLTAISEETKISISLLEGLERDDLSRWPGGIFRRSYIRAYAQAVGLQPDTVMREFLEHYPDPVVEVPAVLAAQAAASNGAQSWAFSSLEFLRAGLASFRPLRDAFSRSADAPSAAAILDAAPSEPAPMDLPVLEHLSIPEPTLAPSESPRRRSAGRPMRRSSVRPATPNRAPEREAPGVERDLVSMARLCTALGCARDQAEVRDILEDAARTLRARGVIVWAWDAMRAALCPVVAHGYSHAVLRKLPRVALNTDNAIAAAFRSEQVRVVEGGIAATGAVAAPLLSATGCVGVLAFEFRNGGEQRECVRAFATILGAQLSTLVPVSALAEAVSA